MQACFTGFKRFKSSMVEGIKEIYDVADVLKLISKCEMMMLLTQSDFLDD